MKTINKTILIMLALLIFNGCSGFLNTKREGHFNSQIYLKNPKFIATVTQDMIDFIQKYYFISKTTFYFQVKSSTHKQNIGIENSLRKVGYGVSYIKKKGQIPFAYKIDFIDKNIIRTTYNIGKVTLSRLYHIENENITPMSSFTTRGFKKRHDSPHSIKIYSNTNQNPIINRKAIVSIPVLNIRSKPSREGAIIGKLYKNSLIYIASTIINTKGEEWCSITQEDSLNNQNEFISSRYIKYLN